MTRLFLCRGGLTQAISTCQTWRLPLEPDRGAVGPASDPQSPHTTHSRGRVLRLPPQAKTGRDLKIQVFVICTGIDTWYLGAMSKVSPMQLKGANAYTCIDHRCALDIAYNSWCKWYVGGIL
ncbi:uncharacterized protein LOC126982526 [Eriocheir sinensis]|uniref:uncharacterized protein LOC126982526 n=1 Tax=Eriocheir sinensis TaxID=95602 RepID=UPI0021C78075|nr:uncharacterized protein LOC126982526 [Eriocheir sinensis]